MFNVINRSTITRSLIDCNWTHLAIWPTIWPTIYTCYYQLVLPLIDFSLLRYLPIQDCFLFVILTNVKVHHVKLYETLLRYRKKHHTQNNGIFIKFSFYFMVNWAILESLTAWKVSKYGVISGLFFPVFGLNREGISPSSVRIQENTGQK